MGFWEDVSELEDRLKTTADTREYDAILRRLAMLNKQKPGIRPGLEPVAVQEKVTYRPVDIVEARAMLEEYSKMQKLLGTYDPRIFVESVNGDRIGVREVENVGRDGVFIIPDFVRRIDLRAFSDAKELYVVKFGKGIETIGEEAFYNCKQLQTIEFAGRVETIGHRAFKGCEKLTELVIPNSVQRMGEDIFIGCKSLKKLVIPNSVHLCGRLTIPDELSGIAETIQIPRRHKEEVRCCGIVRMKIQWT